MNPNTILYFRVAFFAVAAAAVAVDLYLLVVFGPEGTISIFLREIGERWGMFAYLIAFGMGALFCHLFGSR